MGCFTGQHDGRLRLNEALIQLVVDLFYEERPELFRRISADMDGAKPCENLQAPIKLGETGVLLQYELRVLKRTGKPLIDLHPSEGNKTNIDQFIVQVEILVRLWAPSPVDRRWEFTLPIEVLCQMTASTPFPNLALTPIRVTIAGLKPGPLRAAAEHAMRFILLAAMRELNVPVQFFTGPPANLGAALQSVGIDDNEVSTEFDLKFEESP